MKKHCRYIVIVVFLILGGSIRSENRIVLPPSVLDQPIILAAADDSGIIPAVDKKNRLAKQKGKSTSKAVLLSLLLPGAGQLYLGEKGWGEIYLGAEALTWAGFIAFQTRGSWMKQDYINFAEMHAGIISEGKDDEFYKNLTFYDSRDQYNSSGRIIDPSGPYYPVTPEYYWQWDSEDSRLDYRSIRNNSKNEYRKAVFMIGVAVANRVISAIDAFRISKKMKNRLAGTEIGDNAADMDKRILVSIGTESFGDEPGISVKFTRLF